MRSVSDNGATAPILHSPMHSALTNAFSIDLDRGRRTDDFEAGIIETPVRGIPACAAKATRRRRDMPRRRRDMPPRRRSGDGRDGKASEPDANAGAEPPSSR